MTLKIKTGDEIRRDFIGLGEILLRFCPVGAARIQTARRFDVFDGGGEYNVVRNLAACFGHDAAVVTSLKDDALGRLAENLAKAGGVAVSEIRWSADEMDARNGIYFIERGFGHLPPSSCFDRAHTAVSQISAEDFDWARLAAQTRWFHTGGVFTGLSATTPAAAAAAMKAAREAGAIVSYDLNYRDSLWRAKGGRDAANLLNRELLQFADVVFGAFDFDSRLGVYDENEFRLKCERMKKDFPNLQAIVSSLREVCSASRHDLSGAIWHDGTIFKARDYTDCEVFDRVGSGDAFAAGAIHGILQGETMQYAVDCAAAAGVLAMTTAGDNLQVSREEVENLMQGKGAAVKR